MSKIRTYLFVFAMLLLAASAPTFAQSTQHQRWIGSWATSTMLADGGFDLRPLSNVTMREIVHLSTGGSEIRLRFTNKFGIDTLTIKDAHVALSAGSGAIQTDTDHAVTFGGAASITIPPGATIVSDPVAMAVKPLADLAVSFYLPAQVMRAETLHNFASAFNYSADGDVTTAKELPGAARLLAWYFFDGVEVPVAADSRAIVAFGDSITDGARSTFDANHRWPDFLAARLSQDPKLKDVSVLNEGIGGNHILTDGTGPNALARFDRDILSLGGVRYLIILESINDIGRISDRAGFGPMQNQDQPTAQKLEFGLQQIADAAREHGIKVIGATLTPYGGAGYSSKKGEEVREAVNEWIRTSGVFDAVIDFDKITRDPEKPTQFNPAYDAGDHLHPSDAGYKAMADGIDLSLFAK